MKKRRIILACLCLLLGGIMFFPTSRFVILGWLRGESSYQGRPTCYWHNELQQWEFNELNMSTPGGNVELRTGWLRELRKSISDLFLDPVYYLRASSAYQHGLSPLLTGDPESLPVLMALLESEDPAVRHQAIFGLRKIGTGAQSAFPQLLALWRRGECKVEINVSFGIRRAYDFGPDICDALHRIDPEAAKQAAIPGPFSDLVEDIYFVVREPLPPPQDALDEPP